MRLSPSSDPLAEVTARLNDLIRKITYDLPLSLPAQSATPRLFETLLGFLTDPEPERSLALFSQAPLPLLRGKPFGQTLSPLQSWQRLERWSHLWPKETRAEGRRLGIGRGRIPSWRTIENYFAALGLTAVPVLGYIDVPIYVYLLSRGRVPFSTTAAVRLRRPLPSLDAPVDLFHDIGHALAFATEDYRDLILRFARAASGNRAFLRRERARNEIGRFFELSFAWDPRQGSKPAIPLGAIMMAFDPYFRRGKPLLASDPAALARLNRTGHFPSREAWRDQVAERISRLRASR